jgi:hypothetical protein
MQRMLLLLQATAPQAPGLPFWQTTIISALVGTFFGMATSVMMEFVKPVIFEKRLKRRMLKHLDHEFRGNYAMLLDAVEVAQKYPTATPAQKTVCKMTIVMFETMIASGVYSRYKEGEPIVFNDVEAEYKLSHFYASLKAGLGTCLTDPAFMKLAGSSGQEYMQKRKLKVEPLGFFRDQLNMLR